MSHPTRLHSQLPHAPPLPRSNYSLTTEIYRGEQRGCKPCCLHVLVQKAQRKQQTAKQREALGLWRQLLYRASFSKCNIEATKGSGRWSQSPLLAPCLQKRKLRSTHPRSQDYFLRKQLREPRWPAPQISVLLPPTARPPQTHPLPCGIPAILLFTPLDH